MAAALRHGLLVKAFGIAVAVASPQLPEETCAAGAACAREAGSPSSENLLLQIGGAGVSRQQSQGACPNLRDVERQCASDGCTVLADKMQGRSCADYCASSGYTCVAAWEEVEEDCNVKFALTCEESGIQTSDLLCQCAPPGASPPPSLSLPGPGKGDRVHLSTFFWNVHWECSMAARGASHSCKRNIGRRFAELARESRAEIVAAIELSDTSSQPASLVDFGLSGWTQVNGPCASGDGGDAAALAFAPEWVVQSSGGGCLRHDWDTRAFAVARVVPPRAVEGCPSLCVVAIHAPHQSITRGHDVVKSVCGDAAERCAVAMGDWNVPGNGVPALWEALIGGQRPGSPEPDQRSCCWPESSHYGVFDHLATNIIGARHDGNTVHPYQLLEENPVKQHRAVSAKLLLPGDGDLAAKALAAKAITE